MEKQVADSTSDSSNRLQRMTDEDDKRDDVKRVADILGEFDIEELSSLMAHGLKQAIEKSENSDRIVNGPENEIEYYLDSERLPSDQYHDLSRVITKTVLEVSPREVAEVGVGGIADFLRDRDENAVETLLENGTSFNVSEHSDGSIKGRCSATPSVVEAVLTLYIPGLWEAHFFDKEGKAIAARFDDTLQHYWLPESAYRRLGERLDEALFSAVVTKDKLERIHRRKHQDG